MRFVISGATGFIGSLLADRLWRQGHSLLLLSRRPLREGDVERKAWLSWQPGFGGAWEDAVDGADGVINLAGEPIAGKRWSAAQKQKLSSSRIGATRSVIEAIAKAKTKPKFLINASAVGYYGPRGDETVTEKTGPGQDFLRACASGGRRKRTRLRLMAYGLRW